MNLLALALALQAGPTFPCLTWDALPDLQAPRLVDFDRDGNLDVAYVAGVGFALSRGDGNGGFLPPQTLLQHPVAWVLADGDFNGDGWVDLATTAGFLQPIAVALNDGAGGLSPSQQLPVAAGDLFGITIDGDPRCDLLVRNLQGSLSILLSRPSGFVLSAVLATPGRSVASVTWGDFDGDANTDIVALVDPETGTTEHDIVTWFGDGAGAFPRRESFEYELGFLPRGLTLDLDGDGTDELACVAPLGISTHRRVAPGEFRHRTVTTTWSFGGAAGDIDSDGDGDLVFSGTGGRMWSARAAAGELVLDSQPAWGISGSWSVLLGDLDGDARSEFITQEAELGLCVTRSTASGFAGPKSTPLPWSSGWADADLDGDGDRDLVSFDAASARTWRNDGSGGFSAGGSLAVPFPALTRQLVDLDGDLDRDLLLGDGPIPARRLSARNDGTGQFGSSQTTFPILGLREMPGDFNGDGRADLVAFGSQLFLQLGLGDGTFRFPVRTPIPGIGAISSASVADLDLDGHDDLVAVPASGPARLIVFRGGSTAQFLSRLESPTPSLPTTLVRGDFNGDGWVDFVWEEGGSNPRLHYAFGDGTGTFTGFASVASPFRGNRQLFAVRVDGDSRDDLVREREPSGNSFSPSRLEIVLSGPNGLAGTRWQALLDLAPIWHAADVDGDQRVDVVLLANSLLGTVVLKQ